MVRLSGRRLRRRGTAALGLTGAALALVAAPAPAAPQGIYAGSGTKAPGTIVIRTDAAGAKVRSIVYFARATCRDGTLPLADEVTVPVGAPGFDGAGATDLVLTRNARGTFRGTQQAVLATTSYAIPFTVTIKGTLTRTSGRGSIAVSAKVLDRATGAEVDQCNLAATPWAVSRKAGRIYGGVTSQDAPVAIRVNAAGRRVMDFGFSWESSCTTGGGFEIADWLSNFPLSATGKFGDTFTQSYPVDDGGRNDFAYDLHGTLRRTAGSGNVTVTLTAYDSAGASVAVCTTKKVTWRVASG
jgi:hypothetical protein